jgi:hypothetical protein
MIAIAVRLGAGMFSHQEAGPASSHDTIDPSYRAQAIQATMERNGVATISARGPIHARSGLASSGVRVGGAGRNAPFGSPVSHDSIVVCTTRSPDAVFTALIVYPLEEPHDTSGITTVRDVSSDGFRSKASESMNFER